MARRLTDTFCHECGKHLDEQNTQWTEDGSIFCKHHDLSGAQTSAAPRRLSWIERQWLDAIRALRKRPPTRRGQTIISDAALDRAERLIVNKEGR